MKRMRKLRRHAPVALALFLASLSSSCGTLSGLIGRNRTLKHNGRPVTTKQKLLEATRDQLSERVASLYDPINSFQATVNMTPSSGSVYKGQIKEIVDVPAIILFRKPTDIRIVVQAPLVGTQVADMVSNGTEFAMYLSQENKFIHGLNSAPATSKSKIENLRPAAFLSSMTIMPAEQGVETPVLMDLTDEDNALYVLMFMRKMPNGEPRVGRTVWFDRLDLSIVRQMVYDEQGIIVSDTHYASPWSNYNGVLFPSHIDIQRNKEEYGVVMDVKTLQMNKALTDKQFVLTQPEGSTLQEIGATQVPPAKPEPK
jgi:outer membrane lipoprotein-sorting protein